MAKVDYDVVLLNESSITQQAYLYNLVFDKKMEESDCLLFWKKKHYQNPLAKSLIFGVFIDGYLAGMNAYLPTTYQLDGDSILALQSCDSCVDSRFQGRGIWGAIVGHAVKYIFETTSYKVIYGFPNYRNSFPGFVKMGWEVLGNMDNLIMINNSRAFVRTIVGGNNQLLERSAFFLRLQKLFWKVSKKIRVSTCSCDELLWEKHPDCISIFPNDEWLRWKIDYKNLKTISVKKDGQIVATCIYGLDHYNNEQFVKIERLTLSDSKRISFKSVLASVVQYLSETYPCSAFIRVWVQCGHYLEKDYLGLLFLKSSHPNPFIIKQQETEFTGKSWMLSFFDLD